MGLVVTALLGACSRAPVPAGFDFITHTLPSRPTMTAAVEGTLVRTGGSFPGGYCLLLVRGSRDLTFVAWPDRFVLVLTSPGKFEVRGDGKVLRQGDEVRLGGGYIDASFVRHSIPGACQAASYFAAESLP
jgi:hypothetical protein